MRPFGVHHLPEDPEAENWDVLIVGAGMGGATAGYALAAEGHKVLFIEQGHYLFGDYPRAKSREAKQADDPQSPEARLARGKWPYPLQGVTSCGPVGPWATIGCGTGGSSSLYAAQLERMLPSDFEPRRHHPYAADSALPEHWPFEYRELVPYYRRAEALFEVHGSQDPLNPDLAATLGAPPPMSPRDALVFEALERCGLHPYRAHVGNRQVPGCHACRGYLCPRDCKSDAGRVCIVPAVDRHGARVLSDCTVLRLEATPSRVQRVVCRRGGEELRIGAKVVVLAAGAYATPTLLLRSRSEAWPEGLGNGSGLVGRNLMLHTNNQFIFRPRRELPSDGPAKTIALNDFYTRAGVKLGTLQSKDVAISGGTFSQVLMRRAEESTGLRRSLRLSGLGRLTRKVVGRAGAAYYGRGVVMTSILEDLPYHGNRVLLDETTPAGFRFEYHYPEELRRRNATFRSMVRAAVSAQLRVLSLPRHNNLNHSHACGTCRAGIDPSASVVDPFGRSHEVENLFIADASVFASSGGTNPALTIAATALRVAEAVHAQLSSQPGQKRELGASTRSATTGL